MDMLFILIIFALRKHQDSECRQPYVWIKAGSKPLHLFW